MSTAQTIVNQALEHLNLNNGLLPVQARSQQKAFAALVDFLAMQRGCGLYITPQIPSSISQDLREKPFSKLSLGYETAFYAASPLQVKEFPPTFATAREAAWQTLYYQAKPSTEVQYPDILPTGGGNDYNYDYRCRFYSQFDSIDYEIYEKVRKGESLIYYADFDADASMRGTAVSSVVWSEVDGSGIGISNQSLSSNLASAQLTFNHEGAYSVKATATYASTEKKDFFFRFEVV